MAYGPSELGGPDGLNRTSERASQASKTGPGDIENPNDDTITITTTGTRPRWTALKRALKLPFQNAWTNGIVFASWAFLVTFCSVQEARQVSRYGMRLVCTEEDDDEDEHVVSLSCDDGHSYSASCCTTEPYSVAYNLLNVSGGVLGLCQLFYYTAHVAYALTFVVTDFVFLLETPLKVVYATVPLVSGVYAYQHLVYFVLFCSHDASFCAHQPQHYDTVLRLFKSFLTFALLFLVLHLAFVGLYVWTFVTKRWGTWTGLAELEESLFISEAVRVAFKKRRAMRRTFDVKDFVDFWTHKSDESILVSLPERARRVLSVLVDEMTRGGYDNSSYKRAAITRQEFDTFVGAQNVVEHERVWDILTRRRKCEGNRTVRGYAVTMAEEEKEDEDEYDEDYYAEAPPMSVASRNVGASRSIVPPVDCGNVSRDPPSMSASDVAGSVGSEYGTICLDSIEDVMYDLCFRRKRLASALRTDSRVIGLLVKYLSLVLIPGCFVIVSRIFDYGNAFGEGIDLFKTYAVIASFILSKMQANLTFLALMLTSRPFNVGDVIELEDRETFGVESFDTTHTYLMGRTSRVLENTELVKGSVRNLSRRPVSDWFDIEFPPNSTYGVVEGLRAMESYLRQNQRDIRESSVRCEFVSVRHDGRTLRYHWRYKFAVLERKRLQHTRTRIYNALVAEAVSELIRSSIALNVATGGGNAAINDDDALTRHLRASWNVNTNTDNTRT
jgi:hypothetical protein